MAERKCREYALKKGDGEILDGDFGILREAVVEGGDVATDVEWGASECEAGAW